MNLNYINIPSDYANKLYKVGKNKKARCFMEYFFDMHQKRIKSISEYVDSWELTSKGTVHKWIGEFKYEIELFFNGWQFKNSEHYTSVKKSSERQVNDRIENNHSKHTATSKKEEIAQSESERKVNKYNIIELDIERENQFRTLFTLFGFFKMSGKRSKAEEAFVRIQDIAFDNLFYAAKMYLKDTTIKNKYWLPNFLTEQIYVGYMKQQLKVKIGDVWVIGEFNAATETFKANNKSYTLRKDIMLEKLEKSEIKFLVGDAA